MELEKAKEQKYKSLIRKKFVEEWGEELASKIEEAAESHRNGVNDREASDYFQWALIICIGHRCLEKRKNRKYHRIPQLNWKKLKKWIRDNANLGEYMGDVDYLSLFAGDYDYYIYQKKKNNQGYKKQVGVKKLKNGNR